VIGFVPSACPLFEKYIEDIPAPPSPTPQPNQTTHPPPPTHPTRPKPAHPPTWLRRPGTASILMPREGTAHEWMTSEEVTSRRMRLDGWRGVVQVGRVRRWALRGATECSRHASARALTQKHCNLQAAVTPQQSARCNQSPPTPPHTSTHPPVCGQDQALVHIQQPQLPGLGVWRLGFGAVIEAAGQFGSIARAALRGGCVCR